MIIAIDPDGPSSAVQIHDQITGLITTGALARGEQLPSVRQLAADLDVAPGTVAKAYRRLEADGLTVSRTGAGTRISDDAATVSTSVARAARRFAAAGRSDGMDLDDAIRVLRTMW